MRKSFTYCNMYADSFYVLYKTVTYMGKYEKP